MVDFIHSRLLQIEIACTGLLCRAGRNPHTVGDASEASRQQGDEFWRTKWTPMIRRTAEKFGREAPNSRVIVLENTPHYLFRDKEDEVVREMETFYTSIAARN
jgi:hypothetical protein